MKERILKSNYYKNYKFQLTILLVALLFVIVIPILFSITLFASDQLGTSDIGKLILFLLLVPLACFSPGLIYFGYKLLFVKINVNKFKLYTGTIQDINTPVYFRSNYRDVSIQIENTYLHHSKVFKGELYDEIHKGMEVEVAVYQDIVIII